MRECCGVCESYNTFRSTVKGVRAASGACVHYEVIVHAGSRKCVSFARRTVHSMLRQLRLEGVA